MSIHECQYAELIGQPVSWWTNEAGVEVCRWCHVDKIKVTVTKKPVATKE